MTLREAAQQALEALEHGWIEKNDVVAAALRAALAEPEQVQMTAKDFAEMVRGKEDVVGQPTYWAEWPNRSKT
jgi:hypothetical protein